MIFFRIFISKIIKKSRTLILKNFSDVDFYNMNKLNNYNCELHLIFASCGSLSKQMKLNRINLNIIEKNKYPYLFYLDLQFFV
jgi:hypothetical protein